MDQKGEEPVKGAPTRAIRAGAVKLLRDSPGYAFPTELGGIDGVVRCSVGMNPLPYPDGACIFGWSTHQNWSHDLKGLSGLHSDGRGGGGSLEIPSDSGGKKGTLDGDGRRQARERMGNKIER